MRVVLTFSFHFQNIEKVVSTRRWIKGHFCDIVLVLQRLVTGGGVPDLTRDNHVSRKGFLGERVHTSIQKSSFVPTAGLGGWEGLGGHGAWLVGTWLEKTRKNLIKRCAGVLRSHLGARERCTGVLRSHWGAWERCAGVLGSHFGVRKHRTGTLRSHLGARKRS